MTTAPQDLGTWQRELTNEIRAVRLALEVLISLSLLELADEQREFFLGQYRTALQSLTLQASKQSQCGDVPATPTPYPQCTDPDHGQSEE